MEGRSKERGKELNKENKEKIKNERDKGMGKLEKRDN
jgi:hypothetical protein